VGWYKNKPLMFDWWLTFIKTLTFYFIYEIQEIKQTKTGVCCLRQASQT
jgi:hypothetical protein